MQTILDMRPTVVVRHVLVGTVLDNSVSAYLRTLTQQDRDAFLQTVAGKQAEGGSRFGTTGPRSLHLGWGEELGAAVSNKEEIERAINASLELRVHRLAERSVDVLASGGVILGNHVVCDGFQCDRQVRAQTHVHDDHMSGFDTSKGTQNLVMSPETHQLLMAEFNADLLYRENIYPLAPGHEMALPDGRVSLLPNGHMLGSVQVLVENVHRAKTRLLRRLFVAT